MPKQHLFLLAAVVLLGGCAAVQQTRPRPSVNDGLAISVRPLDTDGVPTVEIAVKNVSVDQRFWINTVLPVSHAESSPESTEVELNVMDKNRRRVDDAMCNRFLKPGYETSDFRVLSPGEEVTRRFEFDSGCYSLRSGEVLYVAARYREVSQGRPQPPEDVVQYGGTAETSEWVKLAVPASGGTEVE